MEVNRWIMRKVFFFHIGSGQVHPLTAIQNHWHQFKLFSFHVQEKLFRNQQFWKNHWWKLLKEIFLCQHKWETFRFATLQVNHKHNHHLTQTQARNYETFIENDLSVKVTSYKGRGSCYFSLYFSSPAAPQQHTNCQWMRSDWFFSRVAQCVTLLIFFFPQPLYSLECLAKDISFLVAYKRDFYSTNTNSNFNRGQ